MPYGPAKKGGKETRKDTRWMEGCVNRVQAQGRDKSSAIAICKSTLAKKKG